MISEREKIIKAREILQKIANGINPVNGEAINDESFLNDPRMIRCFYYISDVLERVIGGQVNQKLSKPEKFSITDAEKSLVDFPDHNIGVNEFARCINNVIDLNRSKKLIGMDLNKQLKKMGLLCEKPGKQGKTITIINEKSVEYGFLTERRGFNGNEYDMVLLSDKAKKYLLDNLEEIMNYEN